MLHRGPGGSLVLRRIVFGRSNDESSAGDSHAIYYCGKRVRNIHGGVGEFGRYAKLPFEIHGVKLQSVARSQLAVVARVCALSVFILTPHEIHCHNGKPPVDHRENVRHRSYQPVDCIHHGMKTFTPPLGMSQAFSHQAVHALDNSGSLRSGRDG